ncbi:MAG: hypothetical protein K0U61_07345 [Alphaproteobacteria bacterium]|nr:hypothetical protein [Alphaproteobacteria bacterium]
MQVLNTKEKTTDSDKRFDRIILHIGTEKTGTKAIQHFLQKNRARLIAHQVLYPKIEDSSHASMWEFVAAVHDKPWMQDVGRHFNIANDHDRIEFQEQLSASLERQFAQYPKCRTLILSSEHFQSRLDIEPRISALREYLGKWTDNFKIIVYLRRQDQLALSFLSTRLKSSVIIEQASMMEAILSIPRYYDYIELYNNWANQFGKDNITARLFCPTRWPENSLTLDFSRACELPDLPRENKRLNASLNRQGFQFLRALNARYPIVPGDKSDADRNALVEYISHRYEGKFYPISKAEATQFYASYVEPNEQLRLMAFSDLDGPLFDEDFSEYPDEAEQLDLDQNDIVDLMLNLWHDEFAPSSDRLSFVSRIGSWLTKIRR